MQKIITHQFWIISGSMSTFYVQAQNSGSMPKFYVLEKIAQIGVYAQYSGSMFRLNTKAQYLFFLLKNSSGSMIRLNTQAHYLSFLVLKIS